MNRFRNFKFHPLSSFLTKIEIRNIEKKIHMNDRFNIYEITYYN